MVGKGLEDGEAGQMAGHRLHLGPGVAQLADDQVGEVREVSCAERRGGGGEGEIVGAQVENLQRHLAHEVSQAAPAADQGFLKERRMIL